MTNELNLQEVNGGANDPFAARNDAPSQGVVPVVATEAPVAGTTQPNATPAQTVPASASSPAPVVEEKKPVEGDMVTRAELDRVIAAQRAIQSAADKQIAAAQEQAKAARERATQVERAAKLENPDLTESEKELLAGKWELEDARAELDEERAGVEELYRVTYIAHSVAANEQYGVTPEMLAGLTEPEEIDLVCLRAEIAWVREHGAGKQTLAEALKAPPAEETTKVPAGASAPSDLGGGGIDAPPAEISKGTGIESMMASLKAIPAQAYSFN